MNLFDKGLLTLVLLTIIGILLVLVICVDEVEMKVKALEHRIELLESGTTAYLLE